mgnify:CR=1 FL=1
MITAAIDTNILNDLLDNQKKLDDVFDSIFDEDPFLDSSPTSAEYAVFDDNEYASFNDSDKADVRSKQSIVTFILSVVLEIAVLYYGITFLL